MLRSAETEIYFTEKFRIFEKTFGIEELHDMVKRIDQARKEHTIDPMTGRFIFSKKELEIHQTALEEFKMRHNALSEKIFNTYKIGNRILDLIEKQIIVDYHLRGQQQALFEENPKLEKVAKKLLGYEDFYAFASAPEGVTKDDPKYHRLLDLANSLNVKLEQEIEKYKDRNQQLVDDQPKTVAEKPVENKEQDIN